MERSNFKETRGKGKRTIGMSIGLLAWLLCTQLCQADLYEQALINRQPFVHQTQNLGNEKMVIFAITDTRRGSYYCQEFNQEIEVQEQSN